MRDSGFNRGGRVTGRAGGSIACMPDVAKTLAAAATLLLVCGLAMSTSSEPIGEYVNDALSLAGELDADSSDSGDVIVSREESKELLSSPFVRRKGNEVGSSLLDRPKSSISKLRGFCEMN